MSVDRAGKLDVEVIVRSDSSCRALGRRYWCRCGGTARRRPLISLPRASVLKLLVRRGYPIKLWEPDAAGLGHQWALQGWVLWRWFAQGPESEKEITAAGGDGEVQLCWVDVPAAAQAGGSFALAESIIAAAARHAREK